MNKILFDKKTIYAAKNKLFTLLRKTKKTKLIQIDNNFNFSVDWTTSHVCAFQKTLSKFRNQKKPISILEIGCFEGKTTLWFLENYLHHPDSKIWCIDTFEGGFGYQNFNMEDVEINFKSNIQKYSDKVILCKGKSTNELFKLNDQRFDIIYVDACHAAADVLSDAIFSFHLAKVGGYILFDDYLWDLNPELLLRPKPAIDAFIDIYRNKIQVVWQGYQLHVKKIVE